MSDYSALQPIDPVAHLNAARERWTGGTTYKPRRVKPEPVQTAYLTYKDGLSHPVRVLDSKCSYGRERYLVSPLSGTGETWVEDFRLSDMHRS